MTGDSDKSVQIQQTVYTALVSSLVFGIPILIVAVPAAMIWFILKQPNKKR